MIQAEQSINGCSKSSAVLITVSGRLTIAELFELLLQCHGGVVCPKNLGCKTWHERTQMLIQHRSLEKEKERTFLNLYTQNTHKVSSPSHT